MRLTLSIIAMTSMLFISSTSAAPTFKSTSSVKSIPKPVFELPASAIKVLDGNRKIKKLSDKTVQLPSSGECGWDLKDIKAGDYYIGLFVQFDKNGNTLGKYGDYSYGDHYLFLNGKTLMFSSMNAPVKMGGVYYAEILTNKPYRIKSGDQLRLSPKLRRKAIGSLRLYQHNPGKGLASVRNFFLRSNKGEFFRSELELPQPASNAKTAKAEFSLRNMMPKPMNYDIKLVAMDYFGAPVKEMSKSIKLDPFKIHKGTFDFPIGVSPQYRVSMLVKDSDGHEFEDIARILSSDDGAKRKFQWINDIWSLKEVPGVRHIKAEQMAGGQWKPIKLPRSLHKEGKTHVYWFKAELPVSNPEKNKSYIIHFTSLGYDAMVFVNDKKVGEYTQSLGSTSIDLTSFLKKGENIIYVGVRDEISTLDEVELAKKDAKINRYGRIIAPNGFTGMDETWFEEIPRQHIEKVYIDNSFRQKKIKVRYKTANLKENCEIRAEVLFKGKVVHKLGPGVINKTGTLESSWENPILWDMDNPNLLCLRSELLDENGNVLDVMNTRFGFREMWNEEDKLILNGKRVKLRAIAMSLYHGPRRIYRRYVRAAKFDDGLMARTHFAPTALLTDINDEEGVMAFARAPMVVCVAGFKNESDRYWENAERMALNIVDTRYNRPSIIAWYLSNEWARQDKVGVKRLKALGEAVRKVDKNHMISFGCDLDLDGFVKDHISTHYPVDSGGAGSSAPFPAAGLWYPEGKKLRKGMKVPCGMVRNVANIPEMTPITWGYKPIFINETGWYMCYSLPLGGTRMSGDRAYASPADNNLSHLGLARFFLSRHRDIEPALITPWFWAMHEPFVRVVPPIDIVMIDWHSRWYGGEEVDMRVNLNWDRYFPAEVDFTWRIVDDAGKKVLGETKALKFTPAELKREYLKFKLPEVEKRLDGNIEFFLTNKKGERLQYRSRDVAIFPKPTEKIKCAPFMLYDPNNLSGHFLKSLGLEFKKITKLDATSLSAGDMLVIGRDAAFDKKCEAAGDMINAYVRSGGKVLILRQSKEEDVGILPLDIRVTARSAGINWARSPNHPILSGIDEGDLKNWYDSQVVSRNEFKKPKRGAFIPILDSGMAGVGLENTALLEIPLGKGYYLGSQLNIEESIEKSPSARRLFQNILDYFSAPVKKRAKLACIIQKGGLVEKKLKNIGLIYEETTPNNLDAFDVVFVEIGAVKESDAAKLKKFVNAGGFLILHGVTPEKRKLADILTGGKLDFSEGMPPVYTGRVLRNSSNSLIDGISNGDLHWKRYQFSTAPSQTFTDPKKLIEKPLIHPVRLTGEQGITFPQAIAVMKVGDGTLCVDQLNWETTNPKVAKQSIRLASMLFLNFGASFDIKKSRKLVLPKHVDYVPLDMKKYLNISLRDNKTPGDGRGGWTDQGPELDMRKLKTGRRVLKGVTFNIEKGKSCASLRSGFAWKRGWPDLPGIKVDSKAKVLYLLLSSAWTKKTILAVVKVNYEDGTSASFELSGETNMRDWAAKNPEAPFLNEVGTVTEVADTVSADAWPRKRSIYKIGWPNPYPEKKIKTIDIRNKQKSVILVLGATIGKAKSVAANVKFEPGDRAKAEKLHSEAMALLNSGKTEEGSEKLLAAIKADPTFANPRASLARIYIEKFKNADAEKLLRETIAADHRCYDAYLLLGELLEKQGRDVDAFDVYDASLKMNNNQPRILDSWEKLKNRLGKE